ncbi:MAG: hypothetical protein ACI875_002564 [Planctomycetota bacterium]|jgi:hypothetical protein
MYNAVTAVLALGILAQLRNLASALMGPDISQFGTQISSWFLSLAIVPGIAASVFIFVLFQKKNAAAFWAYAVLTIIAAGGILNIIAILPLTIQAVNTANSPAQIMSFANVIFVAVFIVKIAICWAMWRLIKKGVLTYPKAIMEEGNS